MIRPRVPGDLAACVSVLRAVHEGDGYPANWPDDPEGWLTPTGMIQAWVATDGDEITGHVVLRGADPALPEADGLVARLFVAAHARGSVALAGGSVAHARGSVAPAGSPTALAGGPTTLAGGSTVHAEGPTTTAGGSAPHVGGSAVHAGGSGAATEAGGSEGRVRQGAAAGLMAAVEREAARRGLRLGLDVTDSRRRAMAFYERAGWRRVASARMDWPDTDGRPALLHYYLR
ncbi:GNAT family N-acetyltransferase [Nonomuraea recticatena]|uniref:GNAT family N-acetyltransferase n=1 Tax=Nonomuraea recticatena TaxID=46178 RepID=UPI0031F7920E